MKLYSSIGPNPHVVRMFMAERAIILPTEQIDIVSGVNRQTAYLSTNPHGQSPALILDDGTLVTEITAICEYLDETQPGDSLIGTTPEARAQTRRWTRWADLNIADPLTVAFRGSQGLPMFKDRVICVPEGAPGLKAYVQDRLAWLDEHWEGRKWLAGDHFSLADILLYCFLAFGQQVGQSFNRDLGNISDWFDRMSERDSAVA